MVKFIAIDGHGGSGKSTVAEELSKLIGAEIIHTDDFASFENPKDWWPLVIEKVFKPIENGAKKLSYQRSKWWKDHKPEPVIDQKVTKFMIIEGVTALRTEFRPYINFGIYVNTPKDVCLQRGLDRDRGVDGKNDNEIIDIWEEWFKNEEEYIKRDDPKSYANVVIDGTKPFTEDLKQLIKKLELGVNSDLTPSSDSV